MSDREYWERRAPLYDVFVRLVLGRPIPRMTALTREAVRGCERVLEVAAGTGIVTMAIAGSAKDVVATDYADAMVQIVQERVRSAGLTNVTCERADIYDLPYGPAAFDAVVAANVLHLVPDFPQALAAFRRVLRPGGRVVLPTFCHDENAWSSILSRGLAVTGFPSRRRFTLAKLSDILKRAGLQIGRAEKLGGVIPIGYVEGSFT